MERELTLCILLQDPPAGVDFGLQKGSGSNYETIQTQRTGSQDLHFEFTLRVKEGKDGHPNFLGPFAQGPARDRFVYLDIGTYAGQKDAAWSRRLKIPLHDISWQIIKKVIDTSGKLEARIPGKGRDGSPSCGTVKDFDGWRPVRG